MSSQQENTNLKPKVLEVKNVFRTYHHEDTNIVVLEDVSFDIYEDEFVCLVGPSGCGKSTLLRIIVGLDRPTRGEVLYRGKKVEGVNPKTALVFQNFALIPWLTVWQNVELGLEARGIDKKERERRIRYWLEKVGLDGHENAYPRELSGGMKQRVGFARALALEPEVLCMDEPFSSLDPLTSQNLREELLRLWTGKELPTVSILMVTHSIEEAIFMSDRVLIMSTHPGKIIRDLRVELPRPRNMRDEEFQKIVDEVYTLIV
jgi:NitT/TauT family transport system ATP-binding protein